MIAGFFRHGPAVPRGAEGVAEPDRPLTPEGRKKTVQAAKGLRELELEFEAIFTSALPRALESAEILAEILELGRPKTREALLPGAPSRKLLAELQALKVEAPILVGHEPDLSAAVSLAIGGAGAAAMELKKAGLAVVEFPKGSARGTLQLLLAPSVLRRLGQP